MEGVKVMRLIDADALFRKVKTECNPYGKPTIGFEDGKKVMNWIEQAPTVSGWVSVKDRLPEEDADVLVWNELGIEIAAYTTNPVKRWYSYTGQEVFVKYWMMLPKPPKEVSKDA